MTIAVWETLKSLRQPITIEDIQAKYAECKQDVIDRSSDAGKNIGTIENDVWTSNDQLFVRAYAKEIK